MNNKNKIIILATVILLIAVVIAGSFWLMKNKKGAKLMPSLSEQSPKQNIANPASVYCEQNGGRVEIRTGPDGGQVGYCVFSDGSECEEWAYMRGECKLGDSKTSEIDTSDWQTYRNEKYGFEFKYPKDWKIDNERTAVNEVVFSYIPQEIGESIEAIKFVKNTNNLTLNQIKTNLIPDASVIESQSNIIVGGENASKIDTTEFATSYIIFLHGGNYYVITTMGGLFSDKILSTFKFID